MAKSELDALEAAFRSAQARLGVAAGLVTRDEWMGLRIASPSSGSYGMMMRLLRLILGLRSMSRRLSQSYYQLARAMETGYTVSEDGEDMMLSELRDSFQADLEMVRTLDFNWPNMTAEEKYAAQQMLEVSRGDTDSWNPGELGQSLEDWIDSIVGEDRVINGEKIAWTNDRIQSLDDAMRAFRNVIGEAGIKDLEDKIRRLKQKYADDPDRLLAEIEDAFLTNRDKLAGVIDDAAIGSGRELINDSMMRDKRAVWVARGVRSNPCHFCSMLASRGFVYKSARDAVAGTHPNCHCYPIVRWSKEKPKLPESNQYYQDMWDKVTGDHYGKDKVKAWRKWLAPIRRRNGGKL